jgi:hypothetical protein
LDFAGEGMDVAFGAVGPGGALFDPEADIFLFLGEEAVFYGGHGAFLTVLEKDELVERTGIGIAGDNEGAGGTGFKGEGLGLEVEMAEEETRVVAGEAVFLKDGLDIGDEVHRGIGGAGLVGSRRRTGTEADDGDEAKEGGGCLHGHD